jgi:hypothetical protein
MFQAHSYGSGITLDFGLLFGVEITHIDDAVSTSVETVLYKCIILSHICRIQCSPKYIVNQELPTTGQAEDVQLVIVDEVRHLPGTVWTPIAW